MSFRYYSTKTYNEIGPVAYRQWRADSHCNLIHGYALSFKFEFGTNELDVRNWTVDFGSLRQLKSNLEDWFDHTLLVAADDPMRDELLRLGELGLAKIVEVEATGCEAIASLLYRHLNEPKYGMMTQLGYADRCWCTRIEVRETAANMAYVAGEPSTWYLWERD